MTTNEQDARRERMKPVLDRIPDRWGKYLPNPGWDNLLLELDTQLAELVPDYVINQAKEKFGDLRFYVQLPEDTQEDVANQVYNLIHKAEERSRYYCEDCGAAGATARDGGWIKTLCDDCHGGDRGAA